MKRFLVLIIGLFLLAWLMYHCLHSRPPVIQANVLECVGGQLAGPEYANVKVAVDGRDVLLTGFVPDGTTGQAAGAAANDNCGARVVDNALQIKAAEPFITRMCVDESGAHLSGALGSDAQRQQTLRQAERRFHERFDSDFTIRNDAPAGHEDLLEPLLYELSQIDSGCITIEDTALSVEGSIRTAEARDRLVDELDVAAGNLFTTSYALSVPELSDNALLCQQFYNELVEPGERVLFDFDSADIHEEGQALLDTVEEKSEICTGLMITVTGHTDSVGDPAYNRDLSMRRASAVVDYLVSNGADPAHLTAVGYGETQPRASNDTDEGRARNRRIEFRVRENN